MTTAMLHGAIAWLLTIPLLLTLGAALEATARFGGWYAGLVGTPIWVVPPLVTDPQMADALRNGALAALAVLLLGLVGSVIGGWMASGEPMTIAYYRRRPVTGRATRTA